ncbi:MAG: hypothetical protein A2521_02405 [Deltaproteobacteria bacterium RIFOXYD12_FULL_57_12]|nr:MAG: hypothetical protein A2521_02405 [Deltaproteobacteria bacterium RIFOXYD12_FULL_57_12]
MRSILRCLLVVCLLGFAGRADAGAIYSFVDADGVLHLTNAPVDKRFKPRQFSTDAPSGFGSSRGSSSASYDSLIQTAARRHQVDPLLIKAVIKAESNFNPAALSEKGAMGLMQLMPDTAKDMAVVSAFDPAANIMGGTRYLKKLMELFAGDLELALAAYNAGPERVRQAGGVPLIPETITYVQRVMQHYRRYKSSSAANGVLLTGRD